MTTGLRLLLSVLFAAFAGGAILLALPYVLPGVKPTLIAVALTGLLVGAYGGVLLFRWLPRTSSQSVRSISHLFPLGRSGGRK